jgi:hypothetical protein
MVDSVEWPFVIFQGTQDIVTNAEGCELFHQKAPSQDKAYRVPRRVCPCSSAHAYCVRAIVCVVRAVMRVCVCVM